MENLKKIIIGLILMSICAFSTIPQVYAYDENYQTNLYNATQHYLDNKDTLEVRNVNDEDITEIYINTMTPLVENKQYDNICNQMDVLEVKMLCITPSINKRSLTYGTTTKVCTLIKSRKVSGKTEKIAIDAKVKYQYSEINGDIISVYEQPTYYLNKSLSVNYSNCVLVSCKALKSDKSHIYVYAQYMSGLDGGYISSTGLFTG